MIYPALKAWFDMPIPDEYSKRRPAEDLLCWTDEARKELKPVGLSGILSGIARRESARADERLARMKPEEERPTLRRDWARLLGEVQPAREPRLIEGKSEDVLGGRLARVALEVEPGIVVPIFLITPNDAKGKPPVVVMVAQGGKAGFLKERGDVIAAFLNAGVAVCLADVRGTGETKPGDGSPGRQSSRTSISQTELILGRTVLGNQLRDLRTVIRWLQTRDGIDGKKLVVWGDSFVEPNNLNRLGFSEIRVPLDAPDLPAIAEPGAAQLALFAALYEDAVKVVFTHGGLHSHREILPGAYLYVPHDAVIPGAASLWWFIPQGEALGTPWVYGRAVDAWNQIGRNWSWARPDQPVAKGVIKKLTGQ
jgi:hypothetical protein